MVNRQVKTARPEKEGECLKQKAPPPPVSPPSASAVAAPPPGLARPAACHVMSCLINLITWISNFKQETDDASVARVHIGSGKKGVMPGVAARTGEEGEREMTGRRPPHST